MASLLNANGVALVIASGTLSLFTCPIIGISRFTVAGTVQVVIIAPKHAVRKHLPAIAGLNILQPRPPNTILPISIANPEPIMHAHHGIVAGSENARIMPVTTALKSPRELGFLRKTLQSHSNTTHETMQLAKTISACALKKTIEAATAGKSPMITSSITLCVE
jgi:hypothetical protein